MKNITWTKVKETVKGWQVGDYIRQTSIVVIGVLITFVGSDLITRCSEQKDIKSTMLLIRDELANNRKNFDEITADFSMDERLSSLLVEHDMNCRAIPEDSLKQFRYSIGQIRSFIYTRNALDILKNSMLMQKISDKELLLALTDVYDTLEGYKMSVNGYYDMKEDAVITFYLTLTDEQTEKANEGGWEAWETYLSDRKVRNFLKIAQKYFTPDYRKRIEQKLDEMIQVIEKKYGAK